jgi:hypothetical protein
MSQFFLEINDREPTLSANLTAEDGSYLNLSGASVQLIYQKKNRAEPPITGTATIAGAISGYVTYAWSTTDTTGKGVFYGKWRATLSNGKKISVPNDSLFEFLISDNML